MIKTLTNLFKQDKEKFVVPKGVQDVIPVAAIFDDGIFKVGKDKYSKTYRFTDINYAVASREDKEAMFLEYSELLNSLDSGATTKITINNRRLNRLDFEQTILIPTTGDNLDEYREECFLIRQRVQTPLFRISILLSPLTKRVWRMQELILPVSVQI
jgi:hypothetical protein